VEAPLGLHPRERVMEKIMKGLRFVDSISEWTGKVVSFLIFVLAFFVGYEVIMRYGFNSPTIWVNDLSTMLFGTFIIIGGAYTLRDGGHVNMDVIYGRFSSKRRALLDLITFVILTLPFLGVMLWKGWEAAWKSLITLEHDSTQWGPPIYPFRLMLPLGAFLILFQALAKFVRDLMIVIKGGKGDK
jgi:TRAP-type mannitol/chloroaromatic compound transport system permease small subunit